MPLKTTVLDNIKISQESIFGMGELYKSLFRWFEIYEYDFYEKAYQVANTPNGKNLKIYWVAEKKMDAYVMYVIELSILILGMTDVEIEKNGLKTKTNKGIIEFRVSGYLRKDYNDKWKSILPLRYMYDKIIARHRLNRYETEFFLESKKLTDEIKAFLNLHQF